MINVRGFESRPGGVGGERKHVDQPVGAAGDVVAAEKGIDLVVAVRADVSEAVLADLEQ